MVHEFNNPVPVNTIHGKGYVWYVRDGGNWENDIFCIILCNGGEVKHYISTQFSIENNGTFNIYEKESSKEVKKDGSTFNSNKTTRNKTSVSKTKKRA